MLRLWDLRCSPQAGCLGVIKHAEGCSRLQARGHELISAAASLTETVNCIAARHWDVRKSMAAAAKGGSNTAMQCIRLYCVQGVGAPCALAAPAPELGPISAADVGFALGVSFGALAVAFALAWRFSYRVRSRPRPASHR